MMDTYGWCVTHQDRDEFEIFARADRSTAEAVARERGGDWFVDPAVRCHACNEWSPFSRMVHVPVKGGFVTTHDMERC